MKRLLALKRLSASDLTFFEYHFRQTAGAKQKAINVDTNVFIGSMYPSVPELVETGRIPLDLSIYGPGSAGLHNIQRKIIKQQKNWRLDGELVPDPEGEPKRYSGLRKGDFALIEFMGPIVPNGANMHLIAQADPTDAGIHEALAQAFGGEFSAMQGLLQLSLEEVETVLRPLRLERALSDFLDAADLEDAARGGVEGARRLRERRGRRGRAVSQEEMQQSKRNAEFVGRVGEELLNQRLGQLQENGDICRYIWASSVDAVSPYDFVIFRLGGAPDHVEDAKSTAGGFDNPIHISLAELQEMAHGSVPYWVCRLYEIGEDAGKVRIATDTRGFAQSVLAAFASLPTEVRVDSVSVQPKALPFGPEIAIGGRTTEDITEQMDLL